MAKKEYKKIKYSGEQLEEAIDYTLGLKNGEIIATKDKPGFMSANDKEKINRINVDENGNAWFAGDLTITTKNGEISASEMVEDISLKADSTSVYTKDEVDEKLENKSNKQTVTAHTENLKNPHGVTAEQVGAYTKAEIDDKINHHDHHFAGGYSAEGVSRFEIEEISGNFKSFKNGVIEVSGKTLLGFLSMDYYTNATAQFKLLSGTANVYYGIEYGMLGGGGGFEATSVVLTTEESVTVNAKGSITSLVDLGGATFSENCLIIIEAVDAKIVVEAYKKSVYSDGFMSGEDAEKLQNTYTKEEINNKLEEFSQSKNISLTDITTAVPDTEDDGCTVTDTFVSSAFGTFNIDIQGNVKLKCHIEEGDATISIDGKTVAQLNFYENNTEYTFEGVINEGMSVHCTMSALYFTEFIKKVNISDAITDLEEKVGSIDTALDAILTIQSEVVGDEA